MYNISYIRYPFIFLLFCCFITNLHAEGISNPRLLGSDCTDSKPSGFEDAKEVKIEYAGRDNAVYSNAAAARIQEIVFHDPGDNNCNNMEGLVALGQRVNERGVCGGSSCGYHFYVGVDGRIVQGAPMNRRTNHMPGHNSQGIGISLICAGPKTNLPGPQVQATIGLSEALRVGYNFNQAIPHNSAPNEGIYITSVVRSTPISGRKFLVHYILGGGKELFCKIEGEIPQCTSNCDNSNIQGKNFANSTIPVNFSSPYTNGNGAFIGDSSNWGYPLMTPQQNPAQTNNPLSNLLRQLLSPTISQPPVLPTPQPITATSGDTTATIKDPTCSFEQTQNAKVKYLYYSNLYNKNYLNKFGPLDEFLNKKQSTSFSFDNFFSNIFAKQAMSYKRTLDNCTPTQSL